MSDYKANYNRWLESPAVDEDTKNELRTLDEKEKNHNRKSEYFPSRQEKRQTYALP